MAPSAVATQAPPVGKRKRGAKPKAAATEADDVVKAVPALDELDLAPSRPSRSRGKKKDQEAHRLEEQDAVEHDCDSEGEEEDDKPSKPKRKKGATKSAAKGPSASTGAGATRDMEQQLWNQGYQHVLGVDEAGRGPLAGPVVAAVCCLPPEVDIPGVADSKQLDEAERERLYEVITNTPGVVWAAEVVDHVTIDRVNILQATMQAMSAAARKLPADKVNYLLVDGNRLPKDLPAPARAVVQGDARCYCIAAASIIAKVTRDRLMLEAHTRYPQYNFAQHKGYAVPEHYRALSAHGPCDIHRRSFQPIRGMTGWTREAQLAAEAAAAGVPAALGGDQDQSDTLVVVQTMQAGGKGRANGKAGVKRKAAAAASPGRVGKEVRVGKQGQAVGGVQGKHKAGRSKRMANV